MSYGLMSYGLVMGGEDFGGFIGNALPTVPLVFLISTMPQAICGGPPLLCLMGAPAKRSNGLRIGALCSDWTSPRCPQRLNLARQYRPYGR
jgi:hypothetical protein